MGSASQLHPFFFFGFLELADISDFGGAFSRSALFSASDVVAPGKTPTFAFEFSTIFAVDARRSSQSWCQYRL